WLLLDRVIDAREIRTGGPAGHTDLADLAETFQPLAVTIGLALAAPQMANVIWGNLERGFRLPLGTLGLTYVPSNLDGRVNLPGGGSLVAAGELVAVVMCAVVVARGARRRERGRAELALVVGLFCAVTALDSLGVPFIAADLDTLALATLVV